MRSFPSLLIASIALTLPLTAQDPAPATQMDSVSYIIGHYYGNSIQQQARTDGVDLNVEMMTQGFIDAISGRGRFNDAETREIMSRFQQMMQETKAERARRAAVTNLEEGRKFLVENRAKPGVVELPSGLQYKIITPGTGTTPTSNDQVSVLYTGRLIDGTVFDSATDPDNPVTFPVTGVIAGWTEALMKMKEGAKWELYIPGSLAYGTNPPPGGVIGPNSVLIFEVQLLKVARSN